MTQKEGSEEAADESSEAVADRVGLPALPDGEVLLVIVGAGASHDCLNLEHGYLSRQTPAAPGGERRPWVEVRPPLTMDLARPMVFYNELAVRYPACRPLLDELRRRLGSAGGMLPAVTLEDALAEYAAGLDVNPLVGRHLAAIRFYLRDLFWESTEAMLSPALTGGVTNYSTLVDRCYQWAHTTNSHVCFVSFNYDFLLEQACADYGWLTLDAIPSYVAHPHASVLKPHGSVRWAWRGAKTLYGTRDKTEQATINDGEPPDPQSLRLEPVTVSPRVIGLNNTPRHTQRWPALAPPMRGKTDFVWPPEQRARLDSLQGRVRRVLTIGWRALEPHFTPLLQPLVMSGSRAVTVMGGNAGDADATATRQALGLAEPEHRRRIDPQLVGTGFSSFLAEAHRFDWLLEPVDWPPPW